MFHHRERMLASVERWNIAPRLNRQSVAEHSFYVVLYCSELAERLGLDHSRKVALFEAAMRHDLAEIVTSDMPGPSKRAIVDKHKLAEYEARFMQHIGQYARFEPFHDLAAIIKAADCIDAYFWLSMEVAHGNRLLTKELQVAKERMAIACAAISCESAAYEVEQEAYQFCFGIDLAPRLDTDLPSKTGGPEEAGF